MFPKGPQGFQPSCCMAGAAFRPWGEALPWKINDLSPSRQITKYDHTQGLKDKVCLRFPSSLIERKLSRGPQRLSTSYSQRIT